MSHSLKASSNYGKENCKSKSISVQTMGPDDCDGESAVTGDGGGGDGDNVGFRLHVGN